MSLARQLGVSFAVQGAGAAAVLLATVWLGARGGPEVQGGFSQAKSALEFVAALAMFGLPQALFYFVKTGALAERAARRWALGSTLAALPIGAAAALFVHRPAALGLAALFAVAVAACVAHGQLRVLLLVRDRTLGFNLLTALPQGLALVGVGVVIALALPPGGWSGPDVSPHGAPLAVGSPPQGSLAAGLPLGAPALWWLVFALAYAVAAFAAWRWLRTGSVGGPRTSTAGWRELGHYGLAAWLTAALATAAIYLAQRHVEAAAGAAALGQFTMAMTLVQVPLTPIAYAAPLLLKRWIEQPGAHDSRRWAVWLFALLLAAAALVWGLAAAWPDLGLGPAYRGATRALAVLLAGAAAEAASRLLTVQASAVGLPWVAVQAEAARWAVLLVGALAPLPAGLLPLCAVWALAAGAAALVFAVRSASAWAMTGPAR